MTAKIKLNAASGGGSFSLQAPSSSSNNRVMTLPDTADGTILTTTSPKTGNILQVVQTVKTDVSTLSVATTALTSDIMTVSITPQSTSSKILLYGILNATCTTITVAFVFQRDSTDIGIADASGLRQRRTSATYANGNTIANLSGLLLDSPSTTSAITYRLKACHTSGDTQTITINDNTAGNQAKFINTICSLTAMEVAG